VVLVVLAEAAVLARAAVVACCHLSAWSRSLPGSVPSELRLPD
jgi:hypothetical protein